MTYMHYDKNGNIVGLYSMQIYNEIPTPNIFVPQEMMKLAVEGKLEVINGELIIKESD